MGSALSVGLHGVVRFKTTSEADLRRGMTRTLTSAVPREIVCAVVSASAASHAVTNTTCAAAFRFDAADRCCVAASPCRLAADVCCVAADRCCVAAGGCRFAAVRSWVAARFQLRRMDSPPTCEQRESICSPGLVHCRFRARVRLQFLPANLQGFGARRRRFVAVRQLFAAKQWASAARELAEAAHGNLQRISRSLH